MLLRLPSLPRGLGAGSVGRPAIADPQDIGSSGSQKKSGYLSSICDVACLLVVHLAGNARWHNTQTQTQTQTSSGCCVLAVLAVLAVLRMGASILQLEQYHYMSPWRARDNFQTRAAQVVKDVGGGSPSALHKDDGANGATLHRILREPVLPVKRGVGSRSVGVSEHKPWEQCGDERLAQAAVFGPDIAAWRCK
ncbi:hypothetical protein BD289DRAFT_450022 [Coniella lustricola]|uniref:Uncharacterized protein n=1 Tax=Coniella lustricola TaxID=2025994 RepID=A0A2T3AJZ8_9PEZI|nr:hypothetical protein BD289DRAFT_450022 [Coniella lustricola]